MISIKTEEQIARMRAAGDILFRLHEELAKRVRPGVKTIDIDRLADTFIHDHGATPSFKGYNGFPYAICSSVNSVVVHGFPSDYELQEGDIYSIDAGVYKDDYHSDSARTHPVGEVSEEAMRLITTTEQCFFRGLRMAREGNRLSDISHAVQAHAEAAGYGVVRVLCGHGIGRQMHEDPEVLNFGKPGRGVRLKRGMTICIEPMINQGTEKVITEEDGWTVRTADGKLSSHYEHTILITGGKPEILSAPRGYYDEVML